MYQALFNFDTKTRMFMDITVWAPDWILKVMPPFVTWFKANARKAIHSVFNHHIERAAELNGKQDQNEKDDAHILSAMTASGQFTKEGILDQLMLFMSAGHETTATTTWWLLVESTFLDSALIER